MNTLIQISYDKITTRQSSVTQKDKSALTPGARFADTNTAIGRDLTQNIP